MSIDDSLDKFQKMRRDRIKILRKRLMIAKEVEYRKFIAEVSVKLGFAEKTTKEYLTHLKDLGEIEIKRGKIRWIGNERQDSIKNQVSSEEDKKA